MAIREFLYTRLSGAAGLSALVATRISPMKSLQAGDFPCVTLTKSAGGRDYNHDGVEDMALSYWQFDAWAESHDSAVAVADQIRLALEADSPETGYYCFIDNESYQYEPDTKRHRVMVECRIWFRQVTV